MSDLTREQRVFLDDASDTVLAAYISDCVSGKACGAPGMFALGVGSALLNLKPVEMFDYAIPRLRRRVKEVQGHLKSI